MSRKRFAPGLRAARKAAGKTLAEVGTACRHSYVSVSAWERLRSALPPDCVAPICELLGCDEEALFADMPPELPTELPGLRDCMARTGLNAETLAKQLGVSRTTIYNWQHGRMPFPERMAALCEVLGCTEAELRGEAEA